MSQFSEKTLTRPYLAMGPMTFSCSFVHYCYHITYTQLCLQAHLFPNLPLRTENLQIIKLTFKEMKTGLEDDIFDSMVLVDRQDKMSDE